jgi:hypothetical protein
MKTELSLFLVAFGQLCAVATAQKSTTRDFGRLKLVWKQHAFNAWWVVTLTAWQSCAAQVPAIRGEFNQPLHFLVSRRTRRHSIRIIKCNQRACATLTRRSEPARQTLGRVLVRGADPKLPSILIDRKIAFRRYFANVVPGIFERHGTLV